MFDGSMLSSHFEVVMISISMFSFERKFFNIISVCKHYNDLLNENITSIGYPEMTINVYICLSDTCDMLIDNMF